MAVPRLACQNSVLGQLNWLNNTYERAARLPVSLTFQITILSLSTILQELIVMWLMVAIMAIRLVSIVELPFPTSSPVAFEQQVCWRAPTFLD